MERIEFPDDVAVITVAGDWHGDTYFGLRAIKHAQGTDVLLHTGDFGWTFESSFLDRLDEAAEEADLLVMFVDGNHENFDWLLAQPVDDDGVRRLRRRVWHLPRGFRWEWFALHFLALGGAPSPNRSALTEGVSWWPQERIEYSEALRAIQGGPVDVMITHDCPDGVDVPTLRHNPMKFPPDVLTVAEGHRRLLAEVAAGVQARYLWHGHYHQRYKATLTYEDGTTCAVTGLAHNDAALEKAVERVHLFDLLP